MTTSRDGDHHAAAGEGLGSRQLQFDGHLCPEGHFRQRVELDAILANAESGRRKDMNCLGRLNRNGSEQVRLCFAGAHAGKLAPMSPPSTRAPDEFLLWRNEEST